MLSIANDLKENDEIKLEVDLEKLPGEAFPVMPVCFRMPVMWPRYIRCW